MIARVLSTVHAALDVARLARAVHTLLREKAALSLLAAEQEARADREALHADLMSADLDNKRDELEQVERERNEAVQRAEHAERERQWAVNRAAAMDELCDRDIAEARRRQAEAERQRDEAVAALEHRDAGAEFRRARAN